MNLTIPSLKFFETNPDFAWINFITTPKVMLSAARCRQMMGSVNSNLSFGNIGLRWWKLTV